MLEELFLALHGCKLRLDGAEWRRVVVWCRSHPLFAVLQRDPFTSREARIGAVELWSEQTRNIIFLRVNRS